MSLNKIYILYNYITSFWWSIHLFLFLLSHWERWLLLFKISERLLERTHSRQLHFEISAIKFIFFLSLSNKRKRKKYVIVSDTQKKIQRQFL